MHVEPHHAGRRRLAVGLPHRAGDGRERFERDGDLKRLVRAEGARRNASQSDSRRQHRERTGKDVGDNRPAVCAGQGRLRVAEAVSRGVDGEACARGRRAQRVGHRHDKRALGLEGDVGGHHLGVRRQCGGGLADTARGRLAHAEVGEAQRNHREVVGPGAVGRSRQVGRSALQRDTRVRHRRRAIAAEHRAPHRPVAGDVNVDRHGLLIVPDHARGDARLAVARVGGADPEAADEDRREREGAVRPGGDRRRRRVAEDARRMQDDLGVRHRHAAAVPHDAADRAHPEERHVGRRVLAGLHDRVGAPTPAAGPARLDDIGALRHDRELVARVGVGERCPERLAAGRLRVDVDLDAFAGWRHAVDGEHRAGHTARRDQHDVGVLRVAIEAAERRGHRAAPAADGIDRLHHRRDSRESGDAVDAVLVGRRRQARADGDLGARHRVEQVVVNDTAHHAALDRQRRRGAQ